MDSQDAKGDSKREHLMQALNSAPEDSELYNSALAQLEDIPDIPFYIEHVWKWFWQIRKGLPPSMSGATPLTWEGIKAWRELLQIQIRPIEIEILYEIDQVYLKYVSDEQKKRGK